MTTERLYHQDSYLREFSATVIGKAADGGLILDRTAFYPDSGGQAHDLGSIGNASVSSVADLGDVVSHRLEADAQIGESVACSIDWERRFDLMQQHSGQHLLSAVLENRFGWRTASVHMSPDTCTVELETAEIGEAALHEAELEANRWIQKNLPVTASVHASADGLQLRKPTDREGPIRVVTIAELDASACGGTHVRATGEIGLLLLGKTERIRSNTRVEFACGLRAIHIARQRIDWLTAAAGIFQNSLDSVPELVAKQRDELARITKENKQLAVTLAARDGEAACARLSEKGAADAPLSAFRWVEGGISDAERAYATAFCTRDGAVLLTACKRSGAFLLCSSKQGGIDARAWFQEVAAPIGAKGGGSPLMVNGRFPDPEAAGELARRLQAVSIPERE